MKRFSNIVLFGALANILLLMLFPPYDVLSLTDRGVRYFDAFYPVFSVPPNRTVNADLLFFAIYGVVGNAVVSFTLLSRPQPLAPRLIVLIIAGMVYAAVMTFRTLGGEYKGRDREGLVAAALFWYVIIAAHAVVWYSIYITK